MTSEEITAFTDELREHVMGVWDAYGWLQGRQGDEESGYCSVGAWFKATGSGWGAPLTRRFKDSYVRAARDLFPLSKIETVEQFNDEEGRSEEDVRLVMKHTFSFLAEAMEKTYAILREMDAGVQAA